MSGPRRGASAFIRSVRPHIRYFYRASYAITADHRLAEQVLMEALVRSYLKKAASAAAGLHDAVLAHIRASAFEFLEGAAPPDEWQGLPLPADGQDPYTALFSGDDLLTQRVVVLRYGCAMTVREIASVTGLSDETVKERLTAARRRVARTLKKDGAAREDRACLRVVRRAMSLDGGDKIDTDYIIAELEREIAARHRPRQYVQQALKGVLFVALGLTLCALLWCAGILLLM